MPRTFPTLQPGRFVPCCLRLGVAVWAAFTMAASHAQLLTGGLQAAATPIAFHEFFRRPIGPAGLEPSATLRRADRQLVQLTGYMVQQEIAIPGQFLFTQRPVQMSEHADGEANDLPPDTVLVLLDMDQSDWIVPHIRGPVRLQGELQLGRREDKSGRVYWLTLQLNQDAVRSMGLIELANLVHAQFHRH